MFEYISGKLIQKTKDYAVIDAGGIGYRIYSTMSSLSSLGEAGDTARLYIYMNIKNSSDTFSLYGFATPEERSTFEMILGVSGIGAKTAAALLSNVSTSKFALCVVTNDSKYLSSHTPGLGPKGAQRISNLKINLKMLNWTTFLKTKFSRRTPTIQMKRCRHLWCSVMPSRRQNALLPVRTEQLKI